MFNIKLEEEQVVIKFSLNNGNYDQKNYYKINLTETKYFLLEAGEWTELDWELAIESLEDRMEDIKKDIIKKIINNKSVIYSYNIQNSRNSKDYTKEITRAERHLSENIQIQDFINNYELKPYNV